VFDDDDEDELSLDDVDDDEPFEEEDEPFDVLALLPPLVDLVDEELSELELPLRA
jgi:hypothetical protein